MSAQSACFEVLFPLRCIGTPPYSSVIFTTETTFASREDIAFLTQVLLLKGNNLLLKD